MQDWEEEEIVACYVRKRIRKNINIMFWKKKLKKNKNEEESQDLSLFQQRLQEKPSYRAITNRGQARRNSKKLVPMQQTMDLLIPPRILDNIILQFLYS